MEAEAMDGGDRAREGEDDGNIRPRLDPFLQPPILKAFFEQLPLEQLAKCRLVSKLWYEESLSTWRSKATLKFGEEGIVSTGDDGSRRTTSLEEFLDLWEAEEWASCPFKKFELDQWKFKAGDVEQERFLEMVGGHVTSLTFHWCDFEGRDVVRRIIYQAFPMLEFLKLDRCSFHSDAPTEDEVLPYKEPTFGAHGLKSLNISLRLPDSMMDILSHFHKLTSLCLEKGVADYRNLLETIRLIRAQDQTKLPLTNFDVKFELGPRTASLIELLQLHDQLNLPLQRLEIWFFGFMDCNLNSSEDVLRDILQDHSSTLKHLEFRGNDAYGTCETFPFGVSLENLEELVLPYRFCGNLNYLRYTRKLRVLEIAGVAFSTFGSGRLFSNSAQLEIGDWTLPTLTDLTFDFPLSDCNMRKLMKWMPNVERLSGVELDDFTFSMVCKNWKNLKELRDFGSKLTDQGVLGVGHGVRNTNTRFYSTREGCFYSQEAGGGWRLEEIQRDPNITKLENLTSFYTRSYRLTSASVHEGFLKLANLKCLTLGSIKEIDDEAKAALGTRKIRLNQVLAAMHSRLR